MSERNYKNQKANQKETKMNKLKGTKRAIYSFVALVLSLAGVWQALLPSVTHAYGLFTERTIQMSSSALAATSVSYQVSFKPATSATVKSVAVDFCQNSPIIGDSCTGTNTINMPTVASATVTTTTGPNNFSALTWTVSASGHTFKISNSTGVALTAGVAYTFTINALTNPTDNDTVTGGNQPGTFYARILSFPNDSGSDSAATYTDTAPGNATDAGGIALSTANQITITSKVQERLVFCVYTTGTGNDCTSKSGSAITLGDSNGVLDPSVAYVNTTAKYSISTNASGNAVVNVKGDTLTSGSNTITANASPTASTTGSEQFGLCTYESAAGSSSLSIANVYDGDASGTTSTACTGVTAPSTTNSAAFTFDTSNTSTTYGQTIATKPAGTFSTGNLNFIGNISNSTEAGIYTTTLTFIATGTY